MGKQAEQVKQGFEYTVINGRGIYMGPERRQERRRICLNERVETLLKNFGLDRRLRTNRRRADSSWLLTSNSAVGE
jgi:hypothetical protein